MKNLMRCTTAVLLLSLTTVSFANNAKFTVAQNVVENWFAAMKSQQTSKVESYLAPQFVSIHTDGIVRNKAQEVALIKNLHMQNYKLTDFKFEQSKDVITVTFKDQGNEKIDNKAIKAHAAGRMAVLQDQHGKWVIIAYANLDQIG